jgi:hypothetical protein
MSPKSRVWIGPIAGSILLAALAGVPLMAPQQDSAFPSMPAAQISSSVPSCSTCILGPTTYTRTTEKPVTEVSTFPGNPGAEYILDIDDGGSQGASAIVTLNGDTVYTGAQVRKAVQLGVSNTLVVQLSGKPGSTLTVSLQGQPSVPGQPAEWARTCALTSAGTPYCWR